MANLWQKSQGKLLGLKRLITTTADNSADVVTNKLSLRLDQVHYTELKNQELTPQVLAYLYYNQLTISALGCTLILLFNKPKFKINA